MNILKAKPSKPNMRRTPLAAPRGIGRIYGTFLRRSDIVGILVLAALWFGSGSLIDRRLVILTGIVYAIVAAGLVLLFGAAGQLSLAHAIFLAVGAFTAGNISGRTSLGIEAEIVLAFVIGAAIGVLVGLPSLRVAGLYLAIATFALSFTGQQLLFNVRSLSGGAGGMPAGPLRLFGQTLANDKALLYLGFVTLAVVLWCVSNLLRCRTGRLLRAIRSSETAVQAVAGVSVGRQKVLAFGLSAGIAAVGGVIYMHTIGYLTPSSFDVSLSILLVVTVVIGGAHSPMGAILGAAFVLGLPEVFRSVQGYEGLLYGAALLLLILFFPRGLMGMFESAIGQVRKWLPAGQQQVPVQAEQHRAPVVPRSQRERRGSRPTGGGAELTLDGVSVEFGGLKAVKNVSATLAAGSVVGLLGPNGAGKTTLFNAISGLAPVHGAIRLDGVDISGMAVHRRALHGIGRTFQNLNIHADLTVLDHVLLGKDRFIKYHTAAEAFRMPWVLRTEARLRAEATSLLEQLDLGLLLDERVGDLSYGSQKRVDVARALAGGPRLLLLDEPAAGLPSHEADELIDQVLQICDREAITVFLIEHDVEMVTRVANRTIVVDAGEVIADGDPAAVLHEAAVIEAYLGA